MKVIRAGTRGSHLAVTQTNQVLAALSAHHPNIRFEAVIIKTTGDIRQNMPFADVGTKGMFVKEIEEAILSGDIDLGVHSLKDMPGELPDGLCLLATPRREDPRDALLSNGRALADLPPGAKVGTSSLRRTVQIKATRPDLDVQELRGNLDTRIRKLDEGQYDAIIVACAGLQRLGLAERIVERLSVRTSVPAPGQGALALEGRTGDTELQSLIAAINDPETEDAVTAERAFQAALNAGCSVPAGAHAIIEGDTLTLIAMLCEPDGTDYRQVEESGLRSEARQIGEHAAKILLSDR
jgi:hydroxymethylbilane synthase